MPMGAGDEYRMQLSVYWYLLDEVYPDRVVIADLFYTVEGELVEVESVSKGGSARWCSRTGIEVELGIHPKNSLRSVYYPLDAIPGVIFGESRPILVGKLVYRRTIMDRPWSSFPRPQTKICRGSTPS